MVFKKILVVEDTDSINLGLMSKLNDLGFKTVISSQSCDGALIKIKRAIQDEEPFDLLISDLSFIAATTNPKINTGEELIAEVKRIQSTIKIIAFSVKNQQSVIKQLLEEIKVDGYVCKGLHGLKELHNAILAINKGQIYVCPIAKASLEQKHVFQLDDFEKQLLQLVANGYKQDDIAEYFKSKNISPNSRRSIEDRLSRLRDNFNATTTSQLIYLAQSLDLI
ncbi:Transcriptional regulatory protein RcsB [Kordia antarctica]|uniref:Transcriptional regulatory protein RcsB n=1 Tax=Kordia antarctica TaxID=1218801 RepID=A0A7L4ZKC7_9FLAO|nr:response regulator [Kordia antarctica]QHI37085.1 Transcriptional regulatory protein RcsB [Kordia antarctica]